MVLEHCLYAGVTHTRKLLQLWAFPLDAVYPVGYVADVAVVDPAG